MRNSKDELLNVLLNKPPVKCIKITQEEGCYDEDGFARMKKYILKVGYTPKDLELFLESINFNYDDGYGGSGQNLFGVVWFDDGTWLSRGEYDGSEWWEYNIVPQIPEDII
jgi:hypothetical protein